MFLFVALLTVALAGPAPPAGGQEAAGTAPAEAVSEAGAGEPRGPELAARAWVLVDARSGDLLAAGNAGQALPMGSTDKIMVALVVLEAVAAGEASLDDEVIISGDAASFAVPLYSNVGLSTGDAVSVRDLVMAALISSGNDAAWALAEHFGDGTGDASVERFVGRMNQKARELELEETSFRNPTGLDAPGQYSSARDLATMTRAALEYPLFKDTVATAQAAITTRDRKIPLTNTNDLLFTYGPATGVKTGTTPAAGPSLVASAAAGDESYIAVVLNDEDRFVDSMALLEYGFEAHERRELVVEGREYTRVEVPYRRGETVGLVAEKSVNSLVGPESDVEREVRVSGELPGEARPGERLGEVIAKVDGRRVGQSPLVARGGYERASLGDKVWYTVEGIFE